MPDLPFLLNLNGEGNPSPPGISFPSYRTNAGFGSQDVQAALNFDRGPDQNGVTLVPVEK